MTTLHPFGLNYFVFASLLMYHCLKLGIRLLRCHPLPRNANEHAMEPFRIYFDSLYYLSVIDLKNHDKSPFKARSSALQLKVRSQARYL